MEQTVIPYNEKTKFFYETLARVRNEILTNPTPWQWDKLKEMYGDAYTLPRPKEDTQQA